MLLWASLNNSHPRADIFLSSLLSAPVFFLRLYIGDGYCHSKGGRNELPKYLRAAVAWKRNLYWRTNPRHFLHIFHHSWEKIKVSACKRLRQISRLACEIYVLIDLNRCFVYMCIRVYMPIFETLFLIKILWELEKREQSKRHNMRGNRSVWLSKYYLFPLKTLPFLSNF